MSYNYPSSDSSSIANVPSSASEGVPPPTASALVPAILVAHVVCGALATLLLLPLGVLIPRYGRALSKGRWWFPVHIWVQVIGVILVIAALAIGYQMGAEEGTAHPVSRLRGVMADANLFKGLAVALLTGLGVQVILGPFIHWYKRKRNTSTAAGRSVFHYVHIGLGLVVVILGWATALTGTSTYLSKMTRYSRSTG